MVALQERIGFSQQVVGIAHALALERS